jgi:hypothetical protein
MGKKETTTKSEAPAKRAAKPSARKALANSAAPAPPAADSAETPAVIEQPKRSRRVPGSKPVSTAPSRRSAPTKPTAPSFTQADIALRAYFISEQRRSTGAAGNEQQDWIEAERQLQAEFSRKP